MNKVETTNKKNWRRFKNANQHTGLESKIIAPENQISTCDAPSNSHNELSKASQRQDENMQHSIVTCNSDSQVANSDDYSRTCDLITRYGVRHIYDILVSLVSVENFIRPLIERHIADYIIDTNIVTKRITKDSSNGDLNIYVKDSQAQWQQNRKQSKKSQHLQLLEPKSTLKYFQSSSTNSEGQHVTAQKSKRRLTFSAQQTPPLFKPSLIEEIDEGNNNSPDVHVSSNANCIPSVVTPTTQENKNDEVEKSEGLRFTYSAASKITEDHTGISANIITINRDYYRSKSKDSPSIYELSVTPPSKRNKKSSKDLKGMEIERTIWSDDKNFVNVCKDTGEETIFSKSTYLHAENARLRDMVWSDSPLNVEHSIGINIRSSPSQKTIKVETATTTSTSSSTGNGARMVKFQKSAVTTTLGNRVPPIGQMGQTNFHVAPDPSSATTLLSTQTAVHSEYNKPQLGMETARVTGDARMQHMRPQKEQLHGTVQRMNTAQISDGVKNLYNDAANETHDTQKSPAQNIYTLDTDHKQNPPNVTSPHESVRYSRDVHRKTPDVSTTETGRNDFLNRNKDQNKTTQNGKLSLPEYTEDNFVGQLGEISVKRYVSPAKHDMHLRYTSPNRPDTPPEVSEPWDSVDLVLSYDKLTNTVEVRTDVQEQKMPVLQAASSKTLVQDESLVSQLSSPTHSSYTAATRTDNVRSPPTIQLSDHVSVNIETASYSESKDFGSKPRFGPPSARNIPFQDGYNPVMHTPHMYAVNQETRVYDTTPKTVQYRFANEGIYQMSEEEVHVQPPEVTQPAQNLKITSRSRLHQPVPELSYMSDKPNYHIGNMHENAPVNELYPESITTTTAHIIVHSEEYASGTAQPPGASKPRDFHFDGPSRSRQQQPFNEQQNIRFPQPPTPVHTHIHQSSFPPPSHIRPNGPRYQHRPHVPRQPHYFIQDEASIMSGPPPQQFQRQYQPRQDDTFTVRLHAHAHDIPQHPHGNMTGRTDSRYPQPNTTISYGHEQYNPDISVHYQDQPIRPLREMNQFVRQSPLHRPGFQRHPQEQRVFHDIDECTTITLSTDLGSMARLIYNQEPVVPIIPEYRYHGNDVNQKATPTQTVSIRDPIRIEETKGAIFYKPPNQTQAQTFLTVKVNPGNEILAAENQEVPRQFTVTPKAYVQYPGSSSGGSPTRRDLGRVERRLLHEAQSVNYSTEVCFPKNYSVALDTENLPRNATTQRRVKNDCEECISVSWTETFNEAADGLTNDLEIEYKRLYPNIHTVRTPETIRDVDGIPNTKSFEDLQHYAEYRTALQSEQPNQLRISETKGKQENRQQVVHDEIQLTKRVHKFDREKREYITLTWAGLVTTQRQPVPALESSKSKSSENSQDSDDDNEDRKGPRKSDQDSEINTKKGSASKDFMLSTTPEEQSMNTKPSTTYQTDKTLSDNETPSKVTSSSMNISWSAKFRRSHSPTLSHITAESQLIAPSSKSLSVQIRRTTGSATPSKSASTSRPLLPSTHSKRSQKTSTTATEKTSTKVLKDSDNGDSENMSLDSRLDMRMNTICDKHDSSGMSLKRLHNPNCHICICLSSFEALLFKEITVTENSLNKTKTEIALLCKTIMNELILHVAINNSTKHMNRETKNKTSTKTIASNNVNFSNCMRNRRCSSCPAGFSSASKIYLANI